MKIKEILGENTNYPKSVPASFIIKLINNIHHTPEDLASGDLSNRVWRFRRYKLSQLPISNINVEWNIDQNSINDFTMMPVSTQPPIVFDSVDHSVIDGTHRVAATKLRGDQLILAYVGIDPDPEWSEYSEDEDEDEDENYDEDG